MVRLPACAFCFEVANCDLKKSCPPCSTRLCKPWLNHAQGYFEEEETIKPHNMKEGPGEERGSGRAIPPACAIEPAQHDKEVDSKTKLKHAGHDTVIRDIPSLEVQS